VFVLARALVWTALFVALALVLLPAQLLGPTGLTRPTGLGIPQVAGVLLLYAAVLAAGFHALVVAYEEPTLRRTFGPD
jgi:hypothetical protein